MARGEGPARGGSPGGAGPTSGPGEELAAVLEAASEALRQLKSAQQQADRLVRQAMEMLPSAAEASAAGPRRDPLLSLTEVAEALSISRREVSQLVRDKVIPSVKLSGRTLVPRTWLDDRGEEEMGGLGLA